MYLRSLTLQNLKLLRDVAISFTRSDGEIRPWTVFVGENGLCKTAILQAIALAASGSSLGSELADVTSLPDRRQPSTELMLIGAEFTFGQEGHKTRGYPGMEQRHSLPPFVRSSVAAKSTWRELVGNSRYVGVEHTHVFDPIREARRTQLPGWFVAGYGTARTLPRPKGIQGEGLSDPIKQRLANLFDQGSLIATGFADVFEPAQAKAYTRVLRQVLLQGNLLPGLVGLELQSHGIVRTRQDLLEAHRFEFDLGGQRVKIPATSLSHGYQGAIAWLADLIGYILLEAGRPVPPEKMEGLVLIDELDLHLHPRWQAALVPALKTIFPQLQFVATTHSAMLLPGLEQDEVLVLRQDEDGNVAVTPAPTSPSWLTGSELFDVFFDRKDKPPRSPASRRKQPAPEKKPRAPRAAARTKRK
ncbi:AAA family ATPase [Archangium sp.]|uniref:AAA family ATPase n=1 Tax=Archangium sp. TaxID=1872627 RepID=UPI002D734C1A|nr:AAA family ATPase [Archangium sp.]HYO55424.1 AAA family ATPase [Archangium sp.]